MTDALPTQQESEELTILVVDDSRSARSLIKAEIGKGQYKIIEAESGKEAIGFLKANKVDLITLDVEMPDLDGFETCHMIREYEISKSQEHNSSSSNLTPVVFLTASDNLSTRTKGFESGAKEFLGKDFEKGALLEKLNEILRSKDILKGLTAVIADDTAITRGNTVGHLTAQGVSTLEFSDGTEAFDFLKSKGKTIDILILADTITGVSGLHLCNKIRKELSLDLPIIIISSDYERSSMLRFYQAGATDYIVKPYFKEELLARLNSHLKIQSMYKNLENQNSDLKIANNLKDRFLSACTHDLRSPLNGILGFTELLLENPKLEELQKSFLEKIDQSGNELLQLIDELLDFTQVKIKGIREKFERLDLNQTCRDCITSLEVISKKKEISIKLVQSDENPYILGHELSIKRVINNLVSNSIKFSKSGSEISITTESDSDNVTLSFKDNGIGIPQQHLSSVFSGKGLNRAGTNDEKSTGFGLTFVKEIVDQHNAKITVESVEGQGTSFTIIFDIA